MRGRCTPSNRRWVEGVEVRGSPTLHVRSRVSAKPGEALKNTGVLEEAVRHTSAAELFLWCSARFAAVSANVEYVQRGCDDSVAGVVGGMGCVGECVKVLVDMSEGRVLLTRENVGSWGGGTVGVDAAAQGSLLATSRTTRSSPPSTRALSPGQRPTRHAEVKRSAVNTVRTTVVCRPGRAIQLLLDCYVHACA